MLRSNFVLFVAGIAMQLLCSPTAVATVEHGLQRFGDSQWVGSSYRASGVRYARNGRFLSSSIVRGSQLINTGDGRALGNELTGARIVDAMSPVNELTSGSLIFGTYLFSGSGLSWSQKHGTARIPVMMALSIDTGTCLTVAAGCSWSSSRVSFSGSAKLSTLDRDTSEGIVTLTDSTSTGVSEPPSLYMLGTGLIGISVATMRRSRFFRRH